MDGRASPLCRLSTTLLPFRFVWTFELLHITVGQLHIVALVWCAMTLSTSLIVFLAVHTWAKHRHQSARRLSRRRTMTIDFSPIDAACLGSYDMGWLILYVAYLIALLVLPCWQIISYQLPIVSATIITAEQVRVRGDTNRSMEFYFSCDN